MKTKINFRKVRLPASSNVSLGFLYLVITLVSLFQYETIILGFLPSSTDFSFLPPSNAVTLLSAVTSASTMGFLFTVLFLFSTTSFGLCS